MEAYFSLEQDDKGKCLYNILNIKDYTGEIFKPGTIFFRKNIDGTSDMLDGLVYDKEYLIKLVDSLKEGKEYSENILFEIN